MQSNVTAESVRDGREETSEAGEDQVSARPTPRGYAFKNIDAGAFSSAFALTRNERARARASERLGGKGGRGEG